MINNKINYFRNFSVQAWRMFFHWIKKPKISSGTKRVLIKTTYIVLFAMGSFSLIYVVIPALQQTVSKPYKETKRQLSYNAQIIKEKKSKELVKSITQLNKKLTEQKPRNSYMIVNISDNRFYVYKKDELLRQGKCSTGSYIKLIWNDKEQWVFKTPRGEYRIQGKEESPVWTKPDWAFIEEGLPIPSANHPSRYEAGVLGDYKLSLGSGYLIHGTLYKRFLGMPVTHGCVRLNDDDLEFVYKTLSIGSKVIMY